MKRSIAKGHSKLYIYRTPFNQEKDSLGEKTYDQLKNAIMNQEEKKYLKDKRYIIVKDIFFRKLKERNDIRISPGDAEETFLALWIFLNKKKPHVFSGFQEPVNISTAEIFYWDHIYENPESREYLRKLLISCKSAFFNQIESN